MLLSGSKWMSLTFLSLIWFCMRSHQSPDRSLGHSLHLDERLRQADKPVPVYFVYDKETGTSWAVPSQNPNSTTLYIPQGFNATEELPGVSLRGAPMRTSNSSSDSGDGFVTDWFSWFCPIEATFPVPQRFVPVKTYSAGLTKEVAATDASSHGKSIDILWYGDSITELWQGTGWGIYLGPHLTVPSIYQKYFGKYNSTLNLAVSSDQVDNQQWRLDQGQLPSVPAKLIVNLIGTNDLGAQACVQYPGLDPSEIAKDSARVLERIKNQTEYILSKQPRSKMLLQGLLPRSGISLEKFYAWPSPYTKAINEINEGLRQYAESDDRIFYVYCGDFAFTEKKDALDPGLIPDALHPSPAGYELMAQCLAPEVDRIMALT
eukprot:jgi/Botrbrau1/15845/Bobra.40_1s0029.1